MTACKWNNEEELCFNLQKLYGGFGYQRYKMGKFEEYSLYLDNKNFLKSQSVITFNDHGGKLMALKPDVTLSIVKNAAPGQPRKVYYKESVYRPDKTTGEFREISQIGLELLGGVDDAATAEVLFLAAKSLEEIDDDYILDVAHPGVVAGLIEDCGAAGFAGELYAFVSAKNTHDLKNFCREKGVDETLSDKLAALVSCGGDCASCELIAGGVKACPVGCIGKKTCVGVCPTGALSVGDGGYAQVEKEKCISCGACIADCPKKIIGRIPKAAKVYIACSNHGKGKEVAELCGHGCIGCGLCAKNCPQGAIEMKDGLPEIDYSKCVGCRVCVQKCPRKCIKEH